MKAIISISIVILAFFGFAIWVQNSITHTAHDIANHLSLLEDAISKEDWQAAAKEMTTVQYEWDHTKRRWQILIDHQEIDNIDSTLVKVKSWVDQESKEECMAELATLKLFVLHIPEREALRITNIF